MKKKFFLMYLLFGFFVLLNMSFDKDRKNSSQELYTHQIDSLLLSELSLLDAINNEDFRTGSSRDYIASEIAKTRMELKKIDFWIRYLEPSLYLKVNGALPIEWENEVFEKEEKPYRRVGAGLSLAETYLDEEPIIKDSLFNLIYAAHEATLAFHNDSISNSLNSYHVFFLANRLYLLNLASIYTTGFECPTNENIIPELETMMLATSDIYRVFDASFEERRISTEYLNLYQQAIAFVQMQSKEPNEFNHFEFIKKYVNPLFALNQKMILQYKIISKNVNDYTLNSEANSIFDKTLFRAQQSRGVYVRKMEETDLSEIKNIGKLLFFDPILSENLSRSCASCHSPNKFYTDTSRITGTEFDGITTLSRNTPSLINILFQHLIMIDGKHTTLLEQGKSVIQNPLEMNSNLNEVLKKVMSCHIYHRAFKHFLKFTPNQKKVNIEQIVSAILIFYSDFSTYDSEFDKSMNNVAESTASVISGFNVFMSKAKCGTCHFVPQFNGVKPPFVNSEFEVIGVPEDTLYCNVSKDIGRALVHPADETYNAFRTPTLRNSMQTKPYMHNGIFSSINDIIDFYKGGGGNGHGLQIKNQTLSSDFLELTKLEEQDLKLFLESLNESIPNTLSPKSLPASTLKSLNIRKVGGIY